MQVVELCETKWRSAPAPIRPAPEASPGVGKKISDTAAGLNTNATPFVPSEPLDLAYETVYDMPVTQQPVSCSCKDCVVPLLVLYLAVTVHFLLFS